MTLPLARATLEELYQASHAARWAVSLETFTEAITTSVRKRFASEPPAARDVDAFIRSLHVADLALACACRAGHEAAWEHFIRELRPPLLAAARAITRSGSAPELADSLFADLFGLSERDGERRSLLTYYHGRARLATWLRTVLAQRHVDAIRASARTVPLEEEPMALAVAQETRPPEPRSVEYVTSTQEALDAAVIRLEPTDRLCLRLYYGEALTLARIGRLFGEHEATVSRRLNRIRRHLKSSVERTLSEVHGLSADAIAECLQTAAASPQLDMSRALEADDGD